MVQNGHDVLRNVLGNSEWLVVGAGHPYVYQFSRNTKSPNFINLAYPSLVAERTVTVLCTLGQVSSQDAYRDSVDIQVR